MEILRAELNEKHVTDVNENHKTDVNENHELTKFLLIDNHEVEWICTLGTGAFANVELVKLKNKQFALKKFKQAALDHQEECRIQVENETRIMKNCHESIFVVKFYGAVISKYSYPSLLLEPCLGGDLWAVMQKCGAFSDDSAKFYSACVIEGLKYLEKSGILYRDLKPENLLLDENGYVKIADLGFSKFIRKDEKSFTVVGTAEYLAPEMLTDQGYSFASTLWSVGILIYEMLTGIPPFVSEDQTILFSKIRVGFYRFPFPKILTSNAVELIRMLCRPKPTHRPGLDVVTRFMWFTGFNWDALKKGTLEAPFQPNKLDKISLDENFDNF